MFENRMKYTLQIHVRCVTAKQVIEFRLGVQKEGICLCTVQLQYVD